MESRSQLDTLFRSRQLGVLFPDSGESTTYVHQTKEIIRTAKHGVPPRCYRRGRQVIASKVLDL